MGKKIVKIYELSFSNGDKYIGSAFKEENRLEAHKKVFNENDIKVKVLKEIPESQRIKWEQYFIAHYTHIGEKLRNKNAGSGNHPSQIEGKYKLAEKIQVLLTKEDIEKLYNIIVGKTFAEGGKPPPLSSYIRDLIKMHIEEETKEQKSYAGDHIKKIIKETKKVKNG